MRLIESTRRLLSTIAGQAQTARRRSVRGEPRYVFEPVEARVLLSGVPLHPAAPLTPDAAGGISVGQYTLAISNNGASVDVLDTSTGQSTTHVLGESWDSYATAVVGNDAIIEGGNLVTVENYLTASQAVVFDAATNQWSSASLAQNQADATVAVVGDKAIFVGGEDRELQPIVGDYTNLISIYDASTGQWSSANLSEARVGLTPTVVGTKVLLAGGNYDAGEQFVISPYLDIYNARTGKTSVTVIPAGPLQNMSADVSGADVTYSGMPASGRAVTLTSVYDTSSGRWVPQATPAAEPPVGRIRPAPLATTVVPLSTSAFMAAQFTVGHYAFLQAASTSTIDIYNQSTGGWSTHTFANFQGDLVQAVVGSLAIFEGDSVGSSPNDQADIFNAKTGQWSVETLPSPQESASVGVVGNEAIFAGGEFLGPGRNPSATSIAAVNVFNSATGTWSSAQLSQARSGIAADVVGDQLVLAGGFVDSGTNTTYGNAIDVYNASTGVWSSTTLPQAQSIQSSATVGDNALLYGVTDPTLGAELLVYDTSTQAITTYAIPDGYNEFSPVTTLGSDALFKSAGDDIDNPDVEIYEAASASWSGLELVQGGQPSVAASIGPYAIFAAGSYETEPSDIANVYDSQTGQLTYAYLSQSGAVQAATVGGDEVFFNGTAASGGTGALDIFNSTTGQWSASTLRRGFNIGLTHVACTASADPAEAGNIVYTFTPQQPILRGTIGRARRGSVAVTLTNTGPVALPAGSLLQIFAATRRHTALVGATILAEVLDAGASLTATVAISGAGARYHLSVYVEYQSVTLPVRL